MPWTSWLSFFGLLTFGGRVICVTYVWDILEPPLNAAEAQKALAEAVPGVSYPMYSQIPLTDFDCKELEQPGFYADASARCQVFHRCDLHGTRTSYLCPNKTIFNQILLTCDHFYNVDCDRSASFVNFANLRLYSSQPLFDSPPPGYVPPSREGSSNALTPKPSRSQNVPVQAALGRATMSPVRIVTTNPTNAFQSALYGVRARASPVTDARIADRGASESADLTDTSTAEPLPVAYPEDPSRHLSLCSLIPAFRSQACNGVVFGTDSFAALRQRPPRATKLETAKSTTDRTTEAAEESDHITETTTEVPVTVRVGPAVSG